MLIGFDSSNITNILSGTMRNELNIEEINLLMNCEFSKILHNKMLYQAVYDSRAIPNFNAFVLHPFGNVGAAILDRLLHSGYSAVEADV